MTARGPHGTAPRIALDVTPLLGRPTGIGVFTGELVRGLAERGEFRLLGYAVTWRGRGRVRELLPDGVAVVNRPLPARPLRAAWTRFPGPPFEWLAGRADLVHGTNFVVPPTRRAARLVTVHDLTPVRFPELCSSDTLAYPALVERAWRRGAWIHTDSAAVADEVRTWLRVRDADAERVVPVHLGVRPQRHGDATRGRTLAGASRYVLALGTVEPRKGHVDLVQAFDAVADADDPGRPEPERVRLVVAGPDGWGTTAFEAAVATARHRARIVRLGWVDDDARADLLAGAAVLAYPSLYEGFGLPPLEAMSVGVPVVCSDAGPLPEVMGDAARLVPASDPVALAAGLTEVLGDDAVRERLAAGGPAHAAGYGWDRCVESISGLYRRILAVG